MVLEAVSLFLVAVSAHLVVVALALAREGAALPAVGQSVLLRRMVGTRERAGGSRSALGLRPEGTVDVCCLGPVSQLVVAVVPAG